MADVTTKIARINYEFECPKCGCLNKKEMVLSDVYCYDDPSIFTDVDDLTIIGVLDKCEECSFNVDVKLASV